MFPIPTLALYCERAGDPGLTAEPLNALSNLGFVIVALLAARRLERSGRGDPAEWALIALVATIGVGSLIFHTLATPWAMAADVLPIGIFVLAYAILVMRRFLNFGSPAIIASLLAVAAGEALLGTIRCASGPCLNGSMPYLPALGLLVLSALMARRNFPDATWRLLAAAGVFAVAITLRTLDHTLCDVLTLFGRPRGTHALWHLLNAATLALLLDAAILTSPHGNGHCAPQRDTS